MNALDSLEATPIAVGIYTDNPLFKPHKAHKSDAAYDVMANIDSRCVLLAGDRVTLSLGFKLILPKDYEAILVPRSGMAANHGITIINSPATIDSGYRGWVKVILLNTDMKNHFVIFPQDRIAQLKIRPITPIRFIDTQDVGESDRGSSGFGSTGS